MGKLDREICKSDQATGASSNSFNPVKKKIMVVP